MSEVLCDMTSCKYNSSCCQSPHESIKTYCTNKKINLIISEEMQCLECAQYEANYDKEIENLKRPNTTSVIESVIKIEIMNKQKSRTR